MSKLHADYYADSMEQLESPLVRNEKIAEDTFLLRVSAPAIAQKVVPGQFVMIRMSHSDAPLIEELSRSMTSSKMKRERRNGSIWFTSARDLSLQRSLFHL